LTVYNILLQGRRQQSRRTKTPNITKDDITSQLIAEMSLLRNVTADIWCFSSVTWLPSSYASSLYLVDFDV